MVDGSAESGDLVVDEVVAVLVESRLKEAMHEIRQPLAAVLALSEVARTSPGVPADVRRCLGQLAEQVKEVSDAAWSVLGARAGDPAETSAPVDVDEVLESVFAAFDLTWSGTLTRQGADGGLVCALDRVVLRRCLVNVIDNATRAAGPQGRVLVTVRRSATHIRVFVDDSGPGFGRVPSGSGTGLLLTRAALQPIGGSLTVGLAPSFGGARVVLSLPAAGHGDREFRAGHGPREEVVSRATGAL
ncbi:sensor histidine kinase [Modestobacter sp. I12A-02662]|uniref:sensor histidine kinase n=1 Tax=Modestobacter sp. I12A-02662 TaxID=1730496 RepID=UPI0034DFD13C